MKRRLLPLFCLTVLLGLFFSSSSFAQAQNSPPEEFLRQQAFTKLNANKPEQRSAGVCDYEDAIDNLWGAGVPTDQKLIVFDRFWAVIDQEFACFQDIPDNWDALRTTYRAEIEQGVSRGRFAAIMSKLSIDLRESHTYTTQSAVQSAAALAPCVPLMVVGGWGDNAHFGAGLTPLPDSSLLVYQAVDNHPLGLVPGDIVTGYDGVPWKVLYKQLLETELPTVGWWWGSSPSSFTHSFLMSAGMNWHLYDTINVIKYATGEKVDYPTSDLISTTGWSTFCTEQLDIPGIPKPDMGSQELFSYGIFPGTNIGYIYGWGWFWEAEAEFKEAVQAVMNTDALIVDFRTNYGGNMFLSNPGLEILFKDQVSTIDFGTRCTNGGHLDMCPNNVPNVYTIAGSPFNSYENPIALLVGPGAISSGDQVALRMQFHPQTRTFGKSTSTAFNAPDIIGFTATGWGGRYAVADAYLFSNPGDYLTHNEFKVDEEVWLTPDDVAKGDDTVVEAALAWINGQTTSTVETERAAAIEVFPNPATQQIQVKAGIPHSLILKDALGRTYLQTDLQRENSQLDVSILSSGVYFLTILDEEQIIVKTERIVKE